MNNVLVRFMCFAVGCWSLCVGVSWGGVVFLAILLGVICDVER